MNILNFAKQEMIIGALVEGSSIRSTERMTGVHRDTIMRLLVKAGDSCEKIMNTEMRNLSCKNIEVDEVWSYVGKKQRHVSIEDNPRDGGRDHRSYLDDGRIDGRITKFNGKEVITYGKKRKNIKESSLERRKGS